MRIFSFTTDIDLPLSKGDSTKVDKGKFYILDERLITEIKLVYGERAISEELSFYKYMKPYTGQNLEGKTIFAFRTSGIGDLMAMMVPIKIIKKRNPSCKVIVGSSEMYSELFVNNPFVDKYVHLPYPLEIVNESDYTIFFQGLVETKTVDSTTINIYDLFIKAFSMNHDDFPRIDKIPEIHFNPDIDHDVAITFEGLGLAEGYPVVGIQLQTSTILRNYPLEKFKHLVSLLNAQDIKTVIIGEPNVTELINRYDMCDEKMSFNFARHCLSLKHLFSIINCCNIFVGADTSGLHIAGALNKPMIGLFGPIPSELRIKYFDNAIGIDGATNCSPCFLHGNRPCRHALSDGYSPCLVVIEPDVIVDTINNELLPLYSVTKHMTPKSKQLEHDVDEKRAIVTLAIGDEAKEMLGVTLDCFMNYGSKTNAEVIVIDDEKINGMYPNLEKFQMAEFLDKYDRILYLDVDIVIHPDCPDLFNIVPFDHVAAVADNFDGIWGNLNRYDEAMEVQRALGFVGWHSGYFNSGVLLFSKHHKGLFSNPELRERFNSQFKDQTLLNFNLFRNGYKFFPLDKKFNGMEINGFTSRGQNPNKTEAYIMHFAHEYPRVENMRSVIDILYPKFFNTLQKLDEMLGEANGK